VAATGDWEWAGRWLGSLRRFADILMGMEVGRSGLVANSFFGRPEDVGDMKSEGSAWWDSTRTGHLESFNNALAFRALNRAAELLERLDAADRASEARAIATRLKSHFLGTFLDRRTKRIMMWLDSEGRSYGFRSHMYLGAAAALGLLPVPLARNLPKHYLEQLHASGYTLYERGLPIFLDPVPAHLHNPWTGKGVEPDGTDQFGVYMNGGTNTYHTYFLLQGLYRAGMRREANELFIKMTPRVRAGELCGGLHADVDRRHPVDGRPIGYEGLLGEQFHFLLAAITGYLGCELTIDGLTINGPDTERIRNLRPNFARVAASKAANHTH